MPTEAEALVKRMKQMNVNNFDQIRENPLSIPEDTSIVPIVRQKKPKQPKPSCKYPAEVATHLEQFLLQEFERYYYNYLGSAPECLPGVFFGPVQAKAIVAHIHLITQEEPLNQELICKIVGGQFFPGQIELHAQAVKVWLCGSFYLQFVNDREAHNQHMQDEVIRLREARKQYLIQHKLDVAAQQKQKRTSIAAKKSESKKRAAEESIASCDLERKNRTVARNAEHQQKQSEQAEAKIQRRWAIQANKAKAAENRSKRNPSGNCVE
jgi:hypothetical protein